MRCLTCPCGFCFSGLTDPTQMFRHNTLQGSIHTAYLRHINTLTTYALCALGLHYAPCSEPCNKPGCGGKCKLEVSHERQDQCIGHVCSNPVCKMTGVFFANEEAPTYTEPPPERESQKSQPVIDSALFAGLADA